MKIQVRAKSASITFDIPKFIGTTGDNAGMFPEMGSQEQIFGFAPTEGDRGTLVFDHADPAQRKPMSAKFLHYWWEKDKLGENKLIVKEDLDVNLFRDKVQINPTFGLMYEDYFTATVASKPSRKRVLVIDLLKFLEGKIDVAELDARVIKQ